MTYIRGLTVVHLPKHLIRQYLSSLKSWWCIHLSVTLVIIGTGNGLPIVQHQDMNSSPPGQNGRHFTDNIFRYNSMNEKFCILIKISLKFCPKGPIDNSIGLDNGLTPNKRQAIIWSNADPIHWPIYAALDRDELTEAMLTYCPLDPQEKILSNVLSKWMWKCCFRRF